VLTATRPRPLPYATRRDRVRWAHAIDALLRDAVAQRPPGRPRLTEPVVVRACAPALRRVRDALLDAHVEVRPQTLSLVAAFVCDGARSPLYGGDPETAARCAEELRTAFTVGLPPLAAAVRQAP
jgi:hypothetical protein